MFELLMELASCEWVGAIGARLGATSFQSWAETERRRRAVKLVQRGARLANDNLTEKAAAAYEKALRLAPGLAEAHHNLAGIQIRRGGFHEACDNLRLAIAGHPLGSEIHNRLAVALRRLNRLPETTASLRKALLLLPGSGHALNNLGDVYQARLMGPQALGSYARANAASPGSATIQSNLGTAHQDLGDFQAATEDFRRAIALDQNHPGAHFNQGILALLQGDFGAGWVGYEWRDRTKGFKPTQRYIDTQWNGAAIPTKTIYVRAEQGLGDILQFVRYIPPLAERCHKVVLQMPARLRRTMVGMEAFAEIISPGDPIPGFDLHSPLSSLPHAFGTREVSIPDGHQYLWAERGLIDKWALALANGGRMRVGIVWAAGPGSETTTKRSIALEVLAPLLKDTRVKWISLQMAPQAMDLSRLPANSCVDLAALQPDMSETAAIIAGLDLVITVDTSIAHLAGALGRPVWVMLSHIPDWRWMLDRPDSPWYPSMRLFRQTSTGDWAGVVEAVGRALEREIIRRRPDNQVPH